METGSGTGRIAALDLARTAALLGMVVYHFTYDLDFFGLIPARTATTGGWAQFAKVVAGSFLFLAGVSLVLAHGRGVRWRPFLRRLAVLAAAAAAISTATWFAMPGRHVFFGILHCIAAASVAGLAFLRAPVAVVLAAAAAAWLAPDLVRIDAPGLAWTGLSARPVTAVDYVPFFPWVAPFLLGLAAARLATGAGLWARLASDGPPGALGRIAAWPGRHSLVIYLVHQPVLIASIWLWLQVSR